MRSLNAFKDVCDGNALANGHKGSRSLLSFDTKAVFRNFDNDFNTTNLD